MIFVDLWAWIALADKSDQYNRKAKAQHKRFVGAGQPAQTEGFQKVIGQQSCIE